MTATIPAVVDNHLDVVQHFPDGKLILGSSNLTGRYWGGSLWLFKNSNDAPDIEKCLAGVETEAGISDAAVLGKDKIIIGLDSGSVELISLKSDPVILSNEFYSCEHDHVISSISVSSNDLFCISSSFDGCIKVWDVETWTCIATYRPAHGNKISRVSCSNVESRVFISCGQLCMNNLLLTKFNFVGSVELISLKSDPVILSNEFYSCEHDHVISSISVSSNDLFCISSSFDGCIKVWDVETWTCIATYRPAHGNKISRVSCSNVESRVFISCGQDDKIFIWDLRLPKPATLVGKDPLKAVPTCVAWKLESPTLFAAGDELGQVILKDIRKCVGSILSETLHQRPIFRLVFSPKFPNLLASCADEEYVVVSDVSGENLEIIYKDDSHSDFVRGLSWHPESNQLYSCSWGKEVFGHNFQTNDIERQDEAS
ncbi:methylosome protein 50-like [Centruroides sculpturatus]|uniref:methylosome protein 50-like n=1 Tax=Centruroides sculpturatus TaxID=218467 RepID=UPI000C6D8427|nr:methylosome protein 50-like [Centruroides sculpturatus]